MKKGCSACGYTWLGIQRRIYGLCPRCRRNVPRSRGSSALLPIMIFYGRVGKADAYWQSMQDGKTWEAFRDSHLASIEKAYGPHSEYLVVDSGYFPPKALVRVDKGGDTYIFTLGMSLLCQPSVEMFSQYPEGLRRAELAMGVKGYFSTSTATSSSPTLPDSPDIPRNYTTFLADGHTVLFDINGEV